MCGVCPTLTLVFYICVFLPTAEGANDFKIRDFLAGSPETFEPHYGEESIF